MDAATRLERCRPRSQPAWPTVAYSVGQAQRNPRGNWPPLALSSVENGLCSPDGGAIPTLSEYPLPMCVPTHAIAETPRCSIDNSWKVVASLENQDWPRPTDICRDLAELVGAPARAVQIAQVHRDPVNSALVAVDGKFNASLNLLTQFLVPTDVARSYGDLQGYLLAFRVQ